MTAVDQPTPPPVMWVDHDRDHERLRPFASTGGNDTRSYVLDDAGLPGLLRCGQCGRHVRHRRPDDPQSFLNRDEPATTTTRKATT